MTIHPKLQVALAALAQRSTIMGLMGAGALLFGVVLDQRHLDAICGVVSALSTCALVFLNEDQVPK